MDTEALSATIADKTARIGVIGLGYVGLPLAVSFAKAGYQVLGLDVDENKLAALRQGRSYIEDVETAEVKLRLYQ